MDSVGAILFRIVIAVSILMLTWIMMGRCRTDEMSTPCKTLAVMGGAVAGVSIIDGRIEFGAAVVALCFLGILQCVLHRFFTYNRNCRYPVVLVRNGQIVRNNLTAANLPLNELLKMLREKAVFDIREVELAMLEARDILSVLRRADYLAVTPRQLKLPVSANLVLVPVIINGQLQEQALVELGFSAEQIIEFRKRNQEHVHKIFAAFMDGQQTLYIADDDEKQA